MTDERCKELMAQVGYPESVTIQQLILQVENETEQGTSKKLTSTRIDSVPCFCHVGERFRLAGKYKYCPCCGKLL